MASPQDSVSMALFCDFENVALGVRDAKFEKFDIKPVLERLLLKGSIVVKKAYCDWDRYKGFKASMHEASFELIEIPHVRQSGKNSADIRLVVDALDLCYTKSHVDTFVIISGDSDFSPLVSKLRENAKKVIGVGVKNSTSDLLVANCDEFIFYDDLVREQQRAAAKRETREASAAAKRASDEDKQPKAEMESRKAKAIAIAVETFDALASERGESGKIWASVLKSAIKRRKPDFSESYYGFRAFGNLLDEAQARGLLEVGRDDKSGAFVYRPSSTAASDLPKHAGPTPAAHVPAAENGGSAETAAGKGRKKSKGPRKQGREQAPGVAIDAPMEAAPVVEMPAGEPAVSTEVEDAGVGGEPVVEAHEQAAESAPVKTSKPRRARKTAAKKPESARGHATEAVVEASAPAQPPAEPAAAPTTASKRAKTPRKSPARAGRTRKAAPQDTGGR
ncbi:NYN domain-containing protein [Trinickia sp.]|uniref:NYN domain-containing protein n=1 Tax=Trinickia sp. TaxID=2571163 RepID=UPI003F7EC4F7